MAFPPMDMKKALVLFHFEQKPVLFHELFMFFPAVAHQLFQLGKKTFHIGKLPVDGSKADIRHLIDSAQLLHRKLPDCAGAYLSFQRILQLLFNLVHHLLQALERNRSLFARPQQTVQQLVSPAVSAHQGHNRILH